ncbi:hypothetical protein IW143_003662, partial [Coemansia sp. RSA 520]
RGQADGRPHHWHARGIAQSAGEAGFKRGVEPYYGSDRHVLLHRTDCSPGRPARARVPHLPHSRWPCVHGRHYERQRRLPGGFHPCRHPV